MTWYASNISNSMALVTRWQLCHTLTPDLSLNAQRTAYIIWTFNLQNKYAHLAKTTEAKRNDYGKNTSSTILFGTCTLVHICYSCKLYIYAEVLLYTQRCICEAISTTLYCQSQRAPRTIWRLLNFHLICCLICGCQSFLCPVAVVFSTCPLLSFVSI